MPRFAWLLVLAACGGSTPAPEPQVGCTRVEGGVVRCVQGAASIEVSELAHGIDREVARTRPLYLTTRVVGPAEIRIVVEVPGGDPGGATAALTPSRAEPVYAGSDGRVDRALAATSRSGMLSYDAVPTGTYVLAIALADRTCTIGSTPRPDAIAVSCR